MPFPNPNTPDSPMCPVSRTSSTYSPAALLVLDTLQTPSVEFPADYSLNIVAIPTRYSWAFHLNHDIPLQTHSHQGNTLHSLMCHNTKSEIFQSRRVEIPMSWSIWLTELKKSLILHIAMGLWSLSTFCLARTWNSVETVHSNIPHM